MDKFEALTPEEFSREYLFQLGRALLKFMHTSEYEAELLYFFPPPPPDAKKAAETPVPTRVTEKCHKCGMYFQYQKGDKATHKACKK